MLTLAQAMIKAAGADSNESVRVILKDGRSLGYFPNVMGPRILGLGDRGSWVLAASASETLLASGERSISLGLLD
jgi:hypothetical protein